MTRIQAIGVVRFSYLCEGGFQITHDTLGARRDFLFQPQRINERFALFEQITLPAIRAQTDPDFLLIVVVSADMPPAYFDRLAALLDNIPQVALVPMDPMPMTAAMKIAVNQFKDPDADIIAHFRLDDDDAVAVDFVEKLRAAFIVNQNLFTPTKRLALDFQNGFVVQASPQSTLIQPVIEQLWTPALCVFLTPRSTGNALTFPHARLGNHMQIIADQTAPMFVRSANAFNDSKRWLNRLNLVPLKDETRATLWDRFRIQHLG